MIINRSRVARTHRQTRSRQSGLGIIEVLVALVVVSFGVLGMASLQLTGMKHSSGGFNRTKALLYAQSMSSRIRLNAPAANAGIYNDFDSDTDVSCDVPPAPYCQAYKGGGATVACSTTELATFDLFSVSCGDLGSGGAEKGVIGTLPNGALSVDCDDIACGAGSVYEITVTWSEGRSRTTTDEMTTKRVQVRLRP